MRRPGHRSRPGRWLAGWAVLLAAALPALEAAAAFDPEAGLPLIRNFPPEVYRAHSQIFATARTADGVMYFGTYGAVVSFDGERWRQYALTGTWTRALAVGPDGLVYVGGGNLLGRLEPSPDRGELRYVSLAERLPEPLRKFSTVWSAAPAGGQVFFGLDGVVLAWRDGGFRSWPFPGLRPAVRAAGPAVFCHAGDQLLRWQEDDWRPFVRDARVGAARRITVLPASGGWLLATENGTLLLADESGRLTPWTTPAAAFLQQAGIRNGVRLGDGGYVFSTAGEGVLQLTADGLPVRRLNASSGLAHSATYGLGLDADQHVWVETANGLSVYDPLAAWSFFDPRNGRPDTIGGEPLRFAGDIVLSMSDVPPRRLVPAPDALGAAQLTLFSSRTSGRLSNGVVMHGALLNGAERGVMRVDGEARLLHATSGQVEDILALSELPEVLVVGMLRGVELVRITPQLVATRVVRVPDFELETTNLIETRGRTVWVGTTSGVALRLQLDASGGLVGQTRFDAARGLPGGSGWVKIHHAHDEPLICVPSGVFRLDATGERVVPDPRFQRWHPMGVNTLPIEGDGQHRFWFQVRRDDGSFEVGRLDTRGPGAPVWTPLPPEISAALGFSGARSITYLAEGTREFLWISGTRSTVRLELGLPMPASRAPGVVISEVVRGAGHWRPRADVLRLPFSREPLRLLFASPSAAAGPVAYESRLLGYEAAWSPATSPEVTYTNLFGGPFTLEVRARDALGRVGDAARTTFAIDPPWHRSAEAYMAYALGAAGAVFGFVRWRLGRAEREQRRLAALVATRTAELAAARDQAEAASRAKSAFLAAMSHELRTPLNGVIGYAQILQTDGRLVPDQRERVRIVQQSGEHLLHMINDVLDLAKIEAGKIELRCAPLALGELLRDVSASHALAAAQKRLGFTLDVSPELPAVVAGDAQKLRQVLENLLGNAIKFTAQGSVTLRVAAADSAAAISFAVADTGPGITAEDQARLFQPFEQVAAHRGDAPGTGLGLAISQALVARMGGTLTLASVPGKGSTFSFVVPLPEVTDLPGAVPRVRRISGYEGPPRRVLVVDDHEVNRRLLVDLLTPLGFLCRAASSAREALEALAADAGAWPALAIVDVRMTGSDGLELTRHLRELSQGRELKVLLMSASVLTFDPSLGRSAGADDFLAKPFLAPELLEKVARLLGLSWREETAEVVAPAISVPISAAVRSALLEVLAQGDLEAFRAAVAQARAAAPASETHWQELDAAAAAFQLSRLRQLLG